MPIPIPAERDIRWGILSAGGITNTIAADLALVPGNVMTAVAARDAGRAADFAARHSIPRSYGNYAELYADPEVDVILIGSTHPYHEEQALAAIAAGKAVLIEKPVTMDTVSATRIFDAARSADVFACEAMWMRTNPLIRACADVVASGQIGEVRSVRASFGNAVAYDPTSRLIDLANGGGALLDLGVYVAAFAWLFLGKPDAVEVSGSLFPTGADATAAMQWSYADGRDAQLWCSMQVQAPNDGLIVGTNGWITVHGPFHVPTAITIHSVNDPGAGPAETRDEHRSSPFTAQEFGYGPEIAEVARCLRAGLIESPLIPHDSTLGVLALLEQALGKLGVHYPQLAEA